MPDISGTEKVAKAAAQFMDTLDAYLAEADAAEVAEVMVIAEVRYDEGEDSFDEVILKSTTDSRVYQRGIVQAALETVQSGGVIAPEERE